MESPLSFDATENFRKKLLSINLPPYKTKGGPSFNDKVAENEIILLNYSVTDTPSVEDIGEQQERILITKNQYGPEDISYGNTITINDDKNYKSPEGLYNLSKTINNQLERDSQNQETLLYIKNIYVPNSGGQDYGISRYDINNDLQKSNKNDIYDITDTFSNKLEQVGNQQEIILKDKNVYFPNGTDYGDTNYQINDDQIIDTTGFGNYTERGLDPIWVGNNKLSINSELLYYPNNTLKNKFRQPVWGGVEYDVNDDQEGLFGTPGNGLFFYNNTTQSQPVIESNLLSIYGNIEEAQLYTINIYKPTSLGLSQQFYGNVKWGVNDDEFNSLTTGFGEYDIRGNDLNWIYNNYVSTKGNQKEGEAYNINPYKPLGNGNNFYGVPRWGINSNFPIITSLGEGEYNVLAGDQNLIDGNTLSDDAGSRRFNQYTANQYKPQSNYGPTQYDVNDDLQGLRESIGEGEYDFPDTVGNYLQNKGTTERQTLFDKNEYRPENSQSQSEIVPFTLIPKPIQSKGNYELSDTDKNQLESKGIEERIDLNIINQYGPETINRVEAPNFNQQVKPNEGEYWFDDQKDSDLENKADTEQAKAYLNNKYVPENSYGNSELVEVENLPAILLNQPYSNETGVSPRTFVSSFYTPYSILIQEDPKGDSGKVSEDSTLMAIASKRLKREFAYRVTAELLQQTLGKLNFLDSSFTQPDGIASTQLSVKPNTDPFDVLGIATGKIPLIQRNWGISVPDLIIGKTLNFAAKLAGLYSPYSFIPGEYFDYPEQRFLTSVTDNPVSALFTKPLINSWNEITSLNIDTASELFLANTGSGTQKQLFTQLYYNKYVPDYRLNSFRDPNIFAPAPNFYIGKRKNFIKGLIKKNELPKIKDDFNQTKRAQVNVYGYSEWSKIYEGDLYEETRFGVETINDFDTGDLQGGFTWGTNYNTNEPQIGKKVGKKGQEYDDNNKNLKSPSFNDALKKNLSGKLEKTFTKGSILDYTQSIVEVANDINQNEKRLRHVGTAINQISKVFNDGYTEMTKGSRVLKWRTKNSVDKSKKSGGIPEGLEYCRVWTKDDPYSQIYNLQKTQGNIRKYDSSVFNNTYNLNIGPMRNSADGSSTNIFSKGVKKYMLSLENLAWRTSNRPGLKYEDLALCERGPNRGRIMWFPPYDVTFDESISTDWNSNAFLGRTEPIYTYTNTKRSGKIGFKIVVDHPCILDKLVQEELSKEQESNFTSILNSFFAGCLTYDPYELASRYQTFSLSDIQEVLEVKELNPQEFKQLVGESGIQSNNQPKEEVIKGGELEETEPKSTEEELISFQKNNPVFYFEHGKPSKRDCRLTEGGQSCETKRKATSAFTSYDVYYAQYLEQDYLISQNSTPQIYKPYFSSDNPWNNAIPKSVENLYIDRVKDLNGDTSSKMGVYPPTSPVSAVQNRKFVNFSLSEKQKPDFYEKYIDINENSLKEFFSYARQSYNTVNDFLIKVLDWLDDVNKIVWDFASSASAGNYNDAANVELSKRRISSFVQFMEKFQTQSKNGKFLRDFFKYDHDKAEADKNKQLSFNLSFKGFNDVTAQGKFSGVKCNLPFPRSDYRDTGTDYPESRFSLNGAACRKVTITNIQPIKKQEEKKETGEQQKSDPGNNTTKTTTEQPPKQEEIIKIIKPEPVYTGALKQNLKGKLVKKLLCECDYFEMLQKDSPLVFNGLKEKLKYFHPAFHAITPEGLNKRLVFLQQCMRPGDTIPTVVETGPGTTELLYKDAFNSAFGAPPICVLRVGDFWHSKIVIDSISLQYPKEGQWDINPEGIGLQPMIAEVSINFNFIGGQGLEKPITQLQNALSFNFYANTEMYDERSTPTEIIKGDYDKEAIEKLLNEVGINDNIQRDKKNQNDFGIPFGTVVSKSLDIPNNSIKGTINYKKNINDFAIKYKEYNQLITQELSSLRETYGFGALSLFNDSRKYSTGKIGSNTNSKMFGVSTKVESNLKKLEKDALKDVADDLNPILAGMDIEDFKFLNKFNVKLNLKDLIKKKVELLKQDMLERNNRITTKALELIKIIDQTNFIYDAKDGYIRDNGEVFIFDISGGTASITTYSSAFQELQSNVDSITSSGNTYQSKLDTYNLYTNGNYKFSNDFNFDATIEYEDTDIDIGPENRLFTLFYKDIVEDSEFAKNFIKTCINNSGTFDRIKDEDKPAWEFFIKNNTDELKNIYTKSKEKTKKDLDDLKNTDEYKTFNTSNDTFQKSFRIDIERVMDFKRQNPTNQTDKENYKKLAPPQNLPGDKFNFKNKFTY